MNFVQNFQMKIFFSTIFVVCLVIEITFGRCENSKREPREIFQDFCPGNRPLLEWLDGKFGKNVFWIHNRKNSLNFSIFSALVLSFRGIPRWPNDSSFDFVPSQNQCFYGSIHGFCGTMGSSEKFRGLRFWKRFVFKKRFFRNFWSSRFGFRN